MDFKRKLLALVTNMLVTNPIFFFHVCVPSSSYKSEKIKRDAGKPSQERLSRLDIKPIRAPGVLIEVLRELAPGGFTWVES